MNTRTGTLAVLALAPACAAFAGAVPATAAPTKVTVRVEGNTKTIFEGPVTTDGHPITKDASGEHPCDGTNGGVNPAPGASMTAALDDATKLAGLDWAGTWDDGFEDFFVSRIGPDEQTDTQFWGYALNGKPVDLGGCQQLIEKGDEVLWAYDLFSKKYILKATSARRIRAGRVLTIRVRDTKAGGPVKGARIGGKKTNRKGVVKLRVKKPGTKRLKATKSDALRSNQLNVKVLPRR